MDTIMTRRIIALIPTSSEDAISKDIIAEELELALATVSKQIKRIRLSGVPILWNRNGIYISYEDNAIAKQNRIINNMRIGYDAGMLNIHNVFTGIINGDYENIYR